MSCNIKTIKTCEIFSDSIFARIFSFDEALQKVTAKIQKSDSPNVQNIELTKISNIFSLEIEPLNLAVGNYTIIYIFEILISGKLIRKTGLIENLSILKSGCNCSGFENKDFNFNVNFDNIDNEINFDYSIVNVNQYLDFDDLTPEQQEAIKGEKGDKGEKGNDGNDGQQGISAFEYWLSKPENIGKTENDFWQTLEPNGIDGGIIF